MWNEDTAKEVGLILSLSKDEAAALTVGHLVLRQAQDEVNADDVAWLTAIPPRCW